MIRDRFPIPFALQTVSLRRLAAVLVVAGLALTAGCSGSFDSSGGPEGPKEYYVVGDVINSTPANATVIPANDSRIDLVPIQRVIRESVENQDGTQVRVNESTYEQVRAALQQTPLYENTKGMYVNSAGLYVNASGTVVRVTMYSGYPA